MKLVITLQLQQDNGTPVVTASKTRNNFTASDIPAVIDFLFSERVKRILGMFGMVADPTPEITLSGTPTMTI